MRDRILHLADLHLGDSHRYLGERAAERAREANGVFSRITDYVLDSDRIGGVLVAGDLFDHYRPPAALVDSVLENLERLRDAGIRTLTVPGNHDEYSYPDGVFREHGSRWPDTLVSRPTPGRVETWELADRSVELYAMAYVAGRSKAPFDKFEVSDSDAVKIAVLHGSLDRDWSDRSLPLTRSNLESIGLDYVALGHIHVPTESRLGENGWIAYPGRIEGGGFDDPGGASLLEIVVQERGVRPDRVGFESRPIESLCWNISGISDLEGLSSKLDQEADRDRILKIELDGLPGFELDTSRLLRQFEGRFYHLHLIPPRGNDILSQLNELAAEPTVRGRFVQIAREALDASRTEDERAANAAALRHGLAAFGSHGR